TVAALMIRLPWGQNTVRTRLPRRRLSDRYPGTDTFWQRRQGGHPGPVFGSGPFPADSKYHPAHGWQTVQADPGRARPVPNYQIHAFEPTLPRFQPEHD